MCVISDSTFPNSAFPNSDVVVVGGVESDEYSGESLETDERPRGHGADNLAYVIYTSGGSTGRPKGVSVTHATVVRLFENTHVEFGFDGNDVWTMFHSFAFDFSVWELWGGALLHGGTLVLVDHEVSRDPDAFRALVAAEGVTVLNQTPSAFYQYIEADLRADSETRLRYVIFGGEAWTCVDSGAGTTITRGGTKVTRNPRLHSSTCTASPRRRCTSPISNSTGRARVR